MKIKVSQSSFCDVLNQVHSVVSSRASSPVLFNVLLEAKGDTLSLTTTDLEVTVKSSIKAKVEKEGLTTLPARRLTNIVSSLPGTEISLASNQNDQATVESGSSFFKIFGMGAKDFPLKDDFQSDAECKIPVEIFKEGIAKTAYAMSRNETRYVLNGIFFSLKDGEFSLVATDGRRLAIFKGKLKNSLKSDREFILPAKAVTELKKMLEGTDDITLKVSQDEVSFEVGSTTLISKLIEGNYPDYEQVIPAEAKYLVKFNREDLDAVVKRVALLAPEREKSSSSVKLTFTDGNLDITANSPEIGEAKESLLVNYKGEKLEVAFNPQYITDPLACLKDESIDLQLIDEVSPGVITEGEHFKYVLMPMRLAS